MKRQKITSSELLCGLCFALCFFAFMLTEAFINERCAVILGSGAVNPVYTFGLVCTGLGFLSFSLLRRLCKKEKSRKTAQTILGILCLGAAMVLLFADHPALFLTSSAAALLLTGHISGCVYYNTAMYFAASRYTGRMIGTGMGAAILLQFVVQNLMPQSVAFIISIFFSVAFVMYFVIKAPKDWILENPLPYSSDTKTDFKKALLLIVAVVLMSLVAGMIDSVLTSFNAEKSYDIYGGVRLFYALGLILAGFLADIKERKYLPLSTVIFFTVMFLDFAPKSSRPELWAGMGRIVRSFTVAVTVLPALNIYGAVGSTVLAVVSCLLSILILLVLLPYLSNDAVSLKPTEELPSESRELSPQERLKLYARRCSLTPRETEVLEKLLTTEDGVQEIADSLYISRRMVQRYISSIYEKTETKTRLGLFQSYMNFTKE